MDNSQNEQHLGDIADSEKNQIENTRRDSNGSDSSVYYEVEDKIEGNDKDEKIVDNGRDVQVNDTTTKIILQSKQEAVPSCLTELISVSEGKSNVNTDHINTLLETKGRHTDDDGTDYLLTSNGQRRPIETYERNTSKLILAEQSQSFDESKDSALFQEKKASQIVAEPHNVKTTSVSHTNFTREEIMYNIIFPDINKFGLEKSFNIMENVVRPHHFQHGEIVWDATVTEGFKMWSRGDLMDMRRMILVLSSCGRWHGSVMAFKHQRPKEFAEFSGKLYNIMQKYLANEEVMKTITKNFDKVLCMLKGIGRGELAEKYKKTAGLFGDILLSNNVKYPVIALHADFWVDNIMFNESVTDSSKPQMFFSNFQLPMIDSPIRDLSYIIYCYGDINLFEDFDFLMHAYYASVSESLLRLGNDPDEIFPYEKMKREWRKYGMFGALMTLLEVFDETDDEDEEEKNALNDIRRSHKLYNKRVADVFIHYGENFLSMSNA